MRKTVKRVVVIGLCAILIASLSGCKKSTSAVDNKEEVQKEELNNAENLTYINEMAGVSVEVEGETMKALIEDSVFGIKQTESGLLAVYFSETYEDLESASMETSTGKGGGVL